MRIRVNGDFRRKLMELPIPRKKPGYTENHCHHYKKAQVRQKPWSRNHMPR